jgi:ABC-type multidrug transport system ATPase subunit
MMTGLIPTDPSIEDAKPTDVSIYGHSVITQLNDARLSMGVCPQHDVLFDHLTVREHILFFAQLKGFSFETASQEAEELMKLFHLKHRLDNSGDELSGGQKRKLSVAIAICGGSKFVVLDEPTAGNVCYKCIE